jgi:hypothetical protein
MSMTGVISKKETSKFGNVKFHIVSFFFWSQIYLHFITTIWYQFECIFPPILACIMFCCNMNCADISGIQHPTHYFREIMLLYFYFIFPLKGKLVCHIVYLRMLHVFFLSLMFDRRTKKCHVEQMECNFCKVTREVPTSWRSRGSRQVSWFLIIGARGHVF